MPEVEVEVQAMAMVVATEVTGTTVDRPLGAALLQVRTRVKPFAAKVAPIIGVPNAVFGIQPM